VFFVNDELTLNINDALLVVDVQNDFLPGGSLPIPEGDQVIPILNDYIDLFKRKNQVYAVRDWHPANHMSFKENGGSWPPHCIQESEGARFSSELRLPINVVTISKGTDPEKENYSSFEAGGLSSRLKLSQIGRVFIGGLATEYCVKNTVLDAIEQGFEVFLLSDAIRGFDLHPGDSENALKLMTSKGVKTTTLGSFSEPLDIPSEEPVNREISEKSLIRADKKKKARLRSRGPYRKARVEH
jgi:nicotinamidase/pyrazinamidase